MTYDYDPIALRRRDLERQIADAQRQLDTIQLVPAEDTYPNGAIIRAQIRDASGGVLTWVFLKVVPGGYDANRNDEVRWYHTGFISHGRGGDGRAITQQHFKSWRALQSWLIDRGRVVEAWQPLMSLQDIIHIHLNDDTPPGDYRAHHVVGDTWEL